MDETCDTDNIEQTEKGFRCAIDVPSVLYKSVYNHFYLNYIEVLQFFPLNSDFFLQDEISECKGSWLEFPNE